MAKEIPIHNEDPKNKTKQKGSWLILILLSAFVITLGEFYIANRKSGFVTGGFLASPISDVFDMALLATSLFMANLAVGYILFQPFLWVGQRKKKYLNRLFALGLFLAFLPLLLTDLIWYQLGKYFGDKVSFLLLKVIANFSLMEMLNQSYSFIFWPAIGFFILFMAVYFFVKLWLKYLPVNASPFGAKGSITFSFILILLSVSLVAGAAMKNKKMNRALGRFPATWTIRFCLQKATDWDRDGAGIIGVPRDRAPLNGSIYPYAIDIPGNGVDENGVMGDLPESGHIKQKKETTPPVFKRRPHFVIFVLESFRADNLFLKVNGKEATPNLNRLATQGIYAQWAFCHNGYTRGGLRSIFLGNPLSPPGPGTLFDDFKANGYRTACISGEDESFGKVDRITGMDRADFFYDARSDKKLRSFSSSSAGSLTLPGEVVSRRLKAYLDEQKDSPAPNFIYINLQDAHFPYHHRLIKPILSDSPIKRSEIGPETREKLIKTYRNTIANADLIIGNMMKQIENALGPDTAVLIVADHGESLFEDGFLGHGHHLIDNQMRIPLILKGFPAVLEEPLGQMEIRKMIHEALKTPIEINQVPKRIFVKGKKVFQYLGPPEYPVMVGWAEPGKRWTIDLHHLKKQKNNGPWEDIPVENEEVYKSLIHYWESFQMAVNK